MKIVILDKSTTTTDSNDINFKGFESLGITQIFDNLTNPQKIIEVCDGVDVIVLNKVVLSADIINQLSPSIKLIVITATGYDNVDIEAASSRGIKVCNVPGYGTHAVSQLVMLLILSCATRLISQIDYMRSYGWDKSAGLSIAMNEVAGKTLGIIGLGEIGLAVAKLGQAFGMNVIAYNRTPKKIAGIKSVELSELAAEADYISLNCALNQQTRHIVSRQFLAKMKSSAFLINTARGGLVDEEALIDALKSKKIAGAALDVLVHEPPQSDNPLLSMNNVILTPHIGWAPVETRQRCIDIAAQNIADFFGGTPQNLLN